MNVIVDNLLVNYVRQGKGQPVLILHGWGDRLESFDELSRLLEDSYEIIRIDLAGFGKSQAPPSTWGLGDYGAYIAKFLAKINVRPSVIIGHSNGGAIAIKGLADGQLSADKLVLLSSAGIRDTKKARKFAWRLAAKAGKSATALLPTDMRQSLRTRLYQSAGSDLLVAPHLEATFKRIVNEDIQAEAAMISLPTLIINGSDDTATPPEFAHTFQKAINGSKLIMIDEAGHFAHQQFAEKIAAAVKDFART